jgi:branched-chain amino acid transport system permease protein
MRDLTNKLDELTGGVALSVILLGIALSILLIKVVAQVFLVPPEPTFVVIEIAVSWAIFAIVVLSLNLEYGFTGIINFGHLAFFLVGGYTFAIISGNPATAVGLNQHWLLGVIAALVLSGVAGGLLAVITVRLRGDFLAIVTLAALEIMLNVVNNFNDITGGRAGLGNLPTLETIVGNYGARLVFTLFLFGGIAVFIYGVIAHITSAPYGRVLRGIRSDELVTRVLGKNTIAYKFQVFVIGSAIAGLGGVLVVLNNGSITPDFFSLNETIIVWTGLFIGGVGNNRGVVGGMGIILLIELGTRYLNETVSDSVINAIFPAFSFGAVRMVIIGLLLVLIIRYRPAGIWGSKEETW